MEKNSCSACDSAFANFADCLNHMRLHKKCVVKCPKCQITFVSLSVLRKHFRQRHPSSSGGPFLKCSVDSCNFADSSPVKVSKHAVGHIIAGQPVFCPFRCRTKKPFGTPNALRIHYLYFHKKMISGEYTDSSANNQQSDQQEQNLVLVERNEFDPKKSGYIFPQPDPRKKCLI